MKLQELFESDFHKSDGDITYHIVKNWWDKKSIALGFITKKNVKTNNYKSFSIYDDVIFDGFDKEEIIGYVIIKKSRDAFNGTHLHVDSEYRRKRYASQLYDFIESSLKIKLTPEFQLTDDGKKFWQNRNKS